MDNPSLSGIRVISLKTNFANPKAGFLKNKKDILYAISQLIDKGDYILGKNVSSFEKEFNLFLGNKGHFVSCASGTDAITLALRANNISEGSKVMVPSHTAPASVLGILRAGCFPYYLDVDKTSLLVSFDNLRELAIKEKCKAFLAVHLYGNGLDIFSLKKKLKGLDIKIIEDSAQSTGTTIRGRQSGTLGDSGCFSFFPTKNLGALGDAGGVWIPTKRLRDKIIALRQYGWDRKRVVTVEGGINSRLDELQAAVLRIRLKDLKKNIKLRRNIAKLYNKHLNPSFVRITQPNFQKSSYHLYVVMIEKRDQLISHMQKKNIYLGVHYFPPNHQNGLIKKFSSLKLKVTETISKKVVSLPIYPELEEREQLIIIKKLNDYKLS